MERMSLAMDLNTVTDLVVPFYTVFVLLVLFMFNKASLGSNAKKIYTFEPPAVGGKKRVFTLKDFEGVWKHESADSLDAWLVAHKKNIAVRLVASQMFFRQRNYFNFSEDFSTFNMIKDFGKDTMTVRVTNVPIADDINDAKEVHIPADDGNGHHFLKAAFDKETGVFHLILTEGPQISDRCSIHMSRSISARNPDLMNAVRRLIGHAIVMFSYS